MSRSEGPALIVLMAVLSIFLPDAGRPSVAAAVALP